MIQDLTDTQLGYFVKNKETALELKSKANACFSAHHYSQALQFYSQALRVAPVDAVDKDNKLVAPLYVNRASSLHKLNLFYESIRDCNRALLISPSYAKCPRQPDGSVLCGYYICRYMLELVKGRYINITPNFMLNAPKTYTVEQIDEVRNIWAEFTLNFKPKNNGG